MALSSGGIQAPRLSPASLQQLVARRARADCESILADYGLTWPDVLDLVLGRGVAWAEMVEAERTDAASLAAGRHAGVLLRATPLAAVVGEIEDAAERHRDTQVMTPEAARRGVTLSYLVDVHVPPGPGDLSVDVRDLTPPEDRP